MTTSTGQARLDRRGIVRGGALAVAGIGGLMVAGAQPAAAKPAARALSGDVHVAATAAELQVTTIDSVVAGVETLGYHDPADGGGATYVRAAAEPSHQGKLQSADGAWWELSRDQQIYPEMFGARGDYDPATGSGTDDAPMINAALAFADRVFLWRKAYRISSTVVIEQAQELIYEGSGYLNTGGNNGAWAEIPCAILVPRGLPQVHQITNMVTECELSGGVVANPNAGDPYTVGSDGRLDTYRLTDFTNQDADGATPATPRQFSAAVKLKRYGLLRNIAIRTTATGGAFYPTSSELDHGDPVDIGVLVENGFFARVEGCTISWAFRIAALAHLQYDASDGFTPQGDCLIVSDSLLEGHRCVLIRHFDYCAITARTATELRIAWFRSHRFGPNGGLLADGKSYTYTAMSHDTATDELVFSGLSRNPVTDAIAVGDNLARLEDNNNSGIGETCFDRVFFRGMTHPRLRVSTDPSYTDVFASSAALIEISGAKARGVKITNVTMHSREDIALFVNDGGDIYFSGAYHEAKSNSTGAAGSRFIALSLEAKRAGMGNVPHPAGEAAYIEFRNWSQTENLTDRTPTYRTAPTIGRFGTVDGLFEPHGSRADDYDTSIRRGTAALRRAPKVRAERHPFQWLSATGATWATFDGDGRFAVGAGIDPVADLTHRSTVIDGGSVRHAVISTDAGEAGVRLENTAGSGELVVTADDTLEVRVGDDSLTRVVVPAGSAAPLQIHQGGQWLEVAAVRSGPTGSRPDVAPGAGYFDTTLGRPVWWTGSQWVDAGGAVV